MSHRIFWLFLHDGWIFDVRWIWKGTPQKSCHFFWKVAPDHVLPQVFIRCCYPWFWESGRVAASSVAFDGRQDRRRETVPIVTVASEGFLFFFFGVPEPKNGILTPCPCASLETLGGATPKFYTRILRTLLLKRSNHLLRMVMEPKYPALWRWFFRPQAPHPLTFGEPGSHRNCCWFTLSLAVCLGITRSFRYLKWRYWTL